MAQFGVLRDFRFSEGDVDDIRGAKVYGLNDDKLGKIDDVIFEHSTGSIHYAVIDTGGWLSSKKFVVPADRLRASIKHDGDYETSLTREQIESFPPYNESDLESESQWKAYEEKYRSAWKDDPVQHREGTDRDVTPAANEVPAPSGSAYVASRQPLTDDADLTERIIPPTADEVEIESSANGIGNRWSTFEERLRERRKEAVSHSIDRSARMLDEKRNLRKAS